MKTNLLASVMVFACAVLLSGCASQQENNVGQLNRDAKASGGQFRYRNDKVNGRSQLAMYRVTPPTPIAVPEDLQLSIANQQLQDDILKKIKLLQNNWGEKTTPVLLGVTARGAVDSAIKEIWMIKQGNGGIRYTITLLQAPQGGIDFKVDGPLD